MLVHRGAVEIPNEYIGIITTAVIVKIIIIIILKKIDFRVHNGNKLTQFLLLKL